MTFANFLWAPDVQTFLLHWLPILFMGLLVVAVFPLMRHMPRTKPVRDQARGLALDRLVGHRRRRRGQGRAARDRRLPARPQALPRARRQGAEGDPPARPARDRQDAARQGGRPRVRRALLLPVGGLVRRDVRRPRRGPDPPPVPDRAQARPRDRVHRRARRRRRPPRDGHQRRARPDAQPAAGRDGRLLGAQGRRRDRRLEPAREARPGAAAPGPLRPPDLRLAARRRRPRADPPRAFAQQAAGRRRRPQAARAPDRGADRRRPREHLQRGGDLRRPPLRSERGDGGLRLRARARRRRHAVAPRADRPREAGRRLPRGRPRRCAASCCRRSTGCTGSRSSRAAARSATP